MQGPATTLPVRGIAQNCLIVNFATSVAVALATHSVGPATNGSDGNTNAGREDRQAMSNDDLLSLTMGLGTATINATCAGRRTYGLLMFSSDQPCLIAKLDVIMRRLDELVWRAPGNRLLFGVERDIENCIVFGSGVIEFNGRDELRGAI